MGVKEQLKSAKTMKAVFRTATNINKEYKSPTKRDATCRLLIMELLDRLQRNVVGENDIIHMEYEFQKYMEYSGEHEIHNFESLALNVLALLISGFEGKELEDRINKVTAMIAIFRSKGKILGLDVVWQKPQTIFGRLAEIPEDDKRLVVFESYRKVK